MAANNGDGVTFFTDLYAASDINEEDKANNDCNSVDIYAGLDNLSSLSEISSKPSTPSRDLLDLYEEILTEEGTAKEASHNDLQQQLEKYQKQNRELMRKLTDVQTQNLGLQNENVVLKKNISALFKTARVEITRKSEEINRLTHRVDSSCYTGIYSRHHGSMALNANCSKPKDTRGSTIGSDDQKQERKHQDSSNEEQGCHFSTDKDRLPHLEKSRSLYASKSPPERFSKNGIHSFLQTFSQESCSHENNKGRMEMNDTEHSSKLTNRSKKDAAQHWNADSKQNVHVQAHRSGKSEQCQESKSTKSNNSLDMQNRVSEYNPIKEKEITADEKPQAKEECHGSGEVEKNEKLKAISKKDHKTFDKDDKNRTMEREQEYPKRSGRISFTHSKSNTLRSPYASRKSLINDSHHINEAVSWRDRDSYCRWERRPTEHNSRERRPSFSHGRESKRADSKRFLSNCERGNKHSKLNWHRSEDKNRLSDKGRLEESRYRRTEEKVTKENASKPEKQSRRLVEQKKNEPAKPCKAEEGSRLSENSGKLSLESVECRQYEAKSNKDLKVSFMEKLHLTISPAKKNSPSVDVQANEELDVESQNHTQILLAHSIISTGISKQIESSLENSNNHNPITLGLESPIAKTTEKTTAGTSEIFITHPIQSEPAYTGTESLPILERLQDTNAVENHPAFDSSCLTEVDADQGAILDDDLELETCNSTADENQEIKSDNIVGMDSIDGCTESVDPSSKQNSASKTGPGEDYAKLSQTPVEDTAVGNIFTVNSGQGESTTNLLPSSSNMIDFNTTVTEVKPDVHDENSVISIDLNTMRHIPAIISPLTSPLRPLVKLHEVSCPPQASVVQSLNRDLPSETVVGNNIEQHSNELNKENEKPAFQADKGRTTDSHMETIEIEEGEIFSSEDEEAAEDKPKLQVRSVEVVKNKEGKASPEDEQLSRSTQAKVKKKEALEDESNALSVSAKVPVQKSRTANMKNKMSKSPNKIKQEKILDISCIKGIKNFDGEPSKIKEVMQMFQDIREYIRKQYVKFKVQFTAKQFHRVIEVASYNFTSLIRTLDWSRMCCSSDCLKQRLCNTIETKLKEIKKNGIVDRIFEQHLKDMKKKLWKFVEEQLDYLFSKLEKMLVKLCNRAELDRRGSKHEITKDNKCSTKAVAETPKHKKKIKEVKVAKSKDTVTHISLINPKPNKPHLKQKTQKEQSKKSKLDAPKNGLKKGINSLMLENMQPREERQKHDMKQDHLIKNQMTATKNGLKDISRVVMVNLQPGEKHERKAQQCNTKQDKINTSKSAFRNIVKSLGNINASSIETCRSKKDHIQSSLSAFTDVREKENSKMKTDAQKKSSLNCEPLADQQVASLTFNLVHDSQMGEDFKSLLQGSILQQNACPEKGQQQFGTPEKQILGNTKCDIVPVTDAESRGCLQLTTVLEESLLSDVSPVKPQLLSSIFQTTVNPDILDESCMLEDPTVTSSGKDIEMNKEKGKSFVSSVLLEDLAVSLTVPSPLKSDSHLSFLKPESIPLSAPEEVINAHYSEDALLEGEDATEQDIHLALESDNSSSRSSCSSSCANLTAPSGFQYHPSQPMQAVIMEKSNDHFIVKIRHAFPVASPTGDQALLTEAKALTDKEKEVTAVPDNLNSPFTSMKETEESARNLNTVISSDKTRISPMQKLSVVAPEFAVEASNKTSCCSDKSDCSEHFHDLNVPGNTVEISIVKSELSPNCSVQASDEPSKSIADVICIDLTEEPLSISKADQSGPIIELCSSTCDVESNGKSSEGGTKKRKKVKISEDFSTKKLKNDLDVIIKPERMRKLGRKAEESDVLNQSSPIKMNTTPRKRGSQTVSSTCSPNSLSAKNLVKKRGEVVMVWTRNDDRDILLDCQKEGPSEQTFMSLASKLDKTSQEVSERFHQLMKLFRRTKSTNS
uniref:CASP8-associated protein 2 n=1 Tax=Geotrypetes seraphini TaxID=260995 RepID=A0A6P8QAC4_GEOSA|nr:CASP8-associated protein 2 [Geotrypetes seraphini]XP_033792629.1 CASP8-associated protein 2 [Geotrypetes seraphini]XP_033792630.1 CASP8-associated protein 2 [Geotrypetes seraphini]